MAINENTVLILGAGASKDIGYPIGEELIFRIIFSIRHESFPMHGRTQKFIDIEQYQKLANALEFYDPLSIDSFLTKHGNTENNFISMGKEFIARTILKCENEKNLTLKFNNHGGGEFTRGNYNWYRFLWDAIVSGTDNETFARSLSNIRIITFNYDVSLDYYLASRITSTSSFLSASEQAEALEILNKNLLHVYGQVGFFNWQKEDGLRHRNLYGISAFENNHRSVNWLEDISNEMAKGIHVIGEERIKNTDWLENAEKIFFLGFGFHNENLQVLGLPECIVKSKHPLISTTNYGDSPKLLRKINQILGRYAQISKESVYSALANDFDLASIQK